MSSLYGFTVSLKLNIIISALINYLSLLEKMVKDHGFINEVNFESKFFVPSRTIAVLVLDCCPFQMGLKRPVESFREKAKELK